MKHEYGRTTLHPWGLGVNNRASDRALPEEAVRNAVNIDFISETELRSRKGMTKVYSALSTKSGYSCSLGMFFVEGPTLKKFDPTTGTATTVLPGVSAGHRTFDYFDGVLYFSDGYIAFKITASAVIQWGMIPPAAPVLSTTAGTYGEGVYLAACCWVDAAGVESGASPVTSVWATSASGIVFNNLPATSDPQVSALRLYLSTANGKEMYHVVDVSPGTVSYTTAAGRYDQGSVLENLFISPAPAGRIIRFYKGRAYVADTVGGVWYTEPFEYDHFNLMDNYLQFPSPVDIMEPVKDGIFFAYGDHTDFYAGNPEDGFDITSDIFNYGGVLGTGKRVPNSDNVCWQSQRGMVVGGQGGQCKNVQEANVAVESAVSGATLIREQDGVRQFIASLKQPTNSPLAATAWITAEQIRREA